MKNILTLFLLITCLVSSYAQKTPNKQPQTPDTLRIANDSLEYEIIIMEVGFNNWLLTQRPQSYYSLAFLENRNRIYVQNYNQRVMQPQRYNPDVYFLQINYDPQVHYGKEVNYLLFMYFRYFEQKYNQNLMSS